VTWDIASPSLSEVGDLAGRADAGFPGEEEIPNDEARAATLLAQWDDHLFALGLAPLRRVYLRAASLLDLEDDEVFFLGLDELREALEGKSPGLRATLAARGARQEELARLRPPPRIEAGRPLPAVGGHLRGVPIGPSFEGRLAPRRDLAALLADPPDREDILVVPALTAQAAVALDHLGIRAVCCEFGGAMSHAALMARELGLSALVGCHGCTDLPAGHLARLDTVAGRLWLAPHVD
jgi:phosphohistidine swiveling domain-containing protein